jgi:hypothetical protein
LRMNEAVFFSSSTTNTRMTGDYCKRGDCKMNSRSSWRRFTIYELLNSRARELTIQK